MQTLSQGYRGVSTLMKLNWDRILTTGTLIFALYASTYIALL